CWGSNRDGRANPAITSPAPPAGTAGAAYTHTFTTAFESPAPTFTLSSGTLPPGLTLSATGVLSGTPTVGGSFGPLTVSATTLAPVATQTFTLTVIAVAPAIVTQPGDVTLRAGATATFSATASGVPAPTVQWQRSINGG